MWKESKECKELMKAEKLVQIIGSDFYTGVPDSQLKALCDYLMATLNPDDPALPIYIWNQ